MKNKYLIFLLIFCFALALGMKANAQEGSESDVVDGSMFSTVIRVDGANIISQKGSAVNIGFDIIGSDYGQAGIKYSIDLVKKTKIDNVETGYLVTQQVFDEKIYVAEDNPIHKEITYNAPDFLSGKYDVYVSFSNEKGKIISQASAGEATFSGTGEYIEINGNSCFLTIQGETPERKYRLLQGVDISEKENLNAICIVKNNFKKSITVTPNFQNYYRNVFGKKLSVSKQASVTLNAGEEKIITLTIPKEQKPQAYDAVLTFSDEKGATLSNQARFHYVIQGLSATIQDAKLDKDSYLKGETATVGIKWTGSANAFPGARKDDSDILDYETVEFQILGQDGKACSEKVTKEVETISGEDNSPNFKTTINQDCQGPNVVIAIKDEDKNVLDEASFLMANGKESGGPNQSVTSKTTKDAIRSAVTAIVVIATIIAFIIIIYMAKKKKSKNYIRIVVFLALIGGMAGILNLQKKLDVKAVETAYADEVTIVYVLKPMGEIPLRKCGSSGFNYETGKWISNGIKAMNDYGCCTGDRIYTKSTKERKKGKVVKIRKVVQCDTSATIKTRLINKKKKAKKVGSLSLNSQVLADRTSWGGPFLSFEMYNVNPNFADKHFDMQVAISNQYLEPGEEFTAEGYFSMYDDSCTNHGSPAAYSYMDVTSPNISDVDSSIEDETKILIDTDKGAYVETKLYAEYYSSDFNNVTFKAPMKPREDTPYYTVRFHAKTYQFKYLIDYWDFTIPECYDTKGGTRTQLEALRECAEKFDNHALALCDYGLHCKKFEATVEIPYKVSCESYNSLTEPKAEIYGNVFEGDATYELTCDYGKAIDNQSKVAAESNYGACNNPTGIGTNIIKFNCPLVDGAGNAATAGSTVHSTCIYNKQGSDCEKKFSKDPDVTVNGCPCSPPEEPISSETCTYAQYEKSCGTICSGTKVCEGCNIQCYTSNADRLTVCHNYTLKTSGSCQISCSNGLKACAGWSEVPPIEE